MRNLVLSALLLVGVGGVAQAQTGHAKPEKKDNLILVQTSDSGEEALLKLGREFVAQGYTVEKLDRDFLTLLIAPKKLDITFRPWLKAKAVASAGPNSRVTLTGDITISAMGRTDTVPAEMIGIESAACKTGFRTLAKVAAAYPGATVTYSQQATTK